MNDGSTTSYFKLNRSCRQGDCISTYLFIIALEILLIEIRNNDSVKGITITDETIKLSAFADDLSIFLKDTSSLTRVLNILNKFAQVSGLKVNLKKSEIMYLGTEKKRKDNCGTALKVVKTVKITGINFGYDQELTDNLNFEPCIEKLERNLNFWKMRHLSLLGRILVTKAQGLAVLNFITSMINTPMWVIKRVKKAMFRYIWKGADKVT